MKIWTEQILEQTEKEISSTNTYSSLRFSFKALGGRLNLISEVQPLHLLHCYNRGLTFVDGQWFAFWFDCGFDFGWFALGKFTFGGSRITMSGRFRRCTIQLVGLVLLVLFLRLGRSFAFSGVELCGDWQFLGVEEAVKDLQKVGEVLFVRVRDLLQYLLQRLLASGFPRILHLVEV